jgi:hypothetical protein
MILRRVVICKIIAQGSGLGEVPGWKKCRVGRSPVPERSRGAGLEEVRSPSGVEGVPGWENLVPERSRGGAGLEEVSGFAVSVASLSLSAITASVLGWGLSKDMGGR